MRKVDVEKYTYRIAWSEEDHAHVSRCIEFPSLTAHGSTAEAAFQEIKAVVNESIQWLAEDGEPIPEPLGLIKFKGNISVRVPPEVHRELIVRSREEGVSLNKFINSKLCSA